MSKTIKFVEYEDPEGIEMYKEHNEV